MHDYWYYCTITGTTALVYGCTANISESYDVRRNKIDEYYEKTPYIVPTDLRLADCTRPRKPHARF